MSSQGEKDLPETDEEVSEAPPAQPDVALQGEDDENEEAPPQRFNISSYGWDSDVEGLVRRLERGDVYTPSFQRKFVWSTPDKSRFIESLILGLPVPTIFLAQDSDSKRLNIVDGQQRLKTLQGYLNGHFRLSGKSIQPDLVGCYFSTDVSKTKKSKTLSAEDARALADAVIHSVVIRPDPGDDDKEKGHEYNRAVIQIFKRLNTSGKPLQAQEVRASVFHGSFEELLRKMNDIGSWRALFGEVHSRLRDVEAILRFIALLNSWEDYKSPMPQFLDDFMEKNRVIDEDAAAELFSTFEKACDAVVATRGANAFKKGGTFLISTFDAVMVGLANRIKAGKSLDKASVEACWSHLENNDDFKWQTEEFVNDTNRVQPRIKLAVGIFG